MQKFSSIKFLKKTLLAPGICPLILEGLGSSAWPKYLM